jgi:hypothetical protein
MTKIFSRKPRESGVRNHPPLPPVRFKNDKEMQSWVRWLMLLSTLCVVILGALDGRAGLAPEFIYLPFEVSWWSGLVVGSALGMLMVVPIIEAIYHALRKDIGTGRKVALVSVLVVPLLAVVLTMGLPFFWTFLPVSAYGVMLSAMLYSVFNWIVFRWYYTKYGMFGSDIVGHNPIGALLVGGTLVPAIAYSLSAVAMSMIVTGNDFQCIGALAATLIFTVYVYRKKIAVLSVRRTFDSRNI